jgi:hypothetical protein
MFSAARKTGLDLAALAARMRERRDQLTGEPDKAAHPLPGSGGRTPPSGESDPALTRRR